MFCPTSKACVKFIFVPKKTRRGFVPEKTPISHRILVWFCLPTFGWFFMVDVGKYTSPMDPHGIWIRVFFLSLSCWDLSLELHAESSKSTKSFSIFLELFETKIPTAKILAKNHSNHHPPQKITKNSLQNFTQNHPPTKFFTPKKTSESVFLPQKQKIPQLLGVFLNFRTPQGRPCTKYQCRTFRWGIGKGKDSDTKPAGGS